MATFNFSLTTSAIVTSNNVRVALYKVSDPLAIHASDTKTGPLGVEQWSFTGLPRVPFICRIQEMSGSTVLQQYDWFTFTPDNNEFVWQSPVWIEVGTTTGLTAGTTTFTFDGTGGKPDWTHGHDITIDRRGFGPMEKDTDFSYDPATQEFNLLTVSDVFGGGEKFFVRFEPLVQQSGISTEAGIFSSTKFITVTETLTADDAGKKIIIKGEDPYLEITLPSLALTAENRPFYFESAPGFHSCVKLISADANKLEYPISGKTHIFLKPGETITLFKSIDSSVSTWRVHEAEGNFKTVGIEFTSYGDPGDLINCVELNDTILDSEEQARLYEFIESLPASAVCNYDDWATGNNKYKFSYKNVANEFHVPDVRGLFQRNTTDARLAGSYQDWTMADHKHIETIGNLPAPPYGETSATLSGTGTYNGTATTQRDLTSSPVNTDGTTMSASNLSTEVRPQNYGSRRFIYV